MMDWNIQSRAHVCQVCGAAFSDGAVYHTALMEDKTGYQRRDICGPCWDGGAAAEMADQPALVSHWLGTFEIRPAQPELIHKQTAETLLRQLVERDDSAHETALFILAVMLERKRVLKVKDQLQRDGRRVIVYEQAGSGDVFTVLDPGLNLDQLDQVQRDVAHLLQHGLPPAGEPAPRQAPEAGEPGSAQPSPLAEPTPEPER
jgi:hypothetical protein